MKKEKKQYKLTLIYISAILYALLMVAIALGMDTDLGTTTMALGALFLGYMGTSQFAGYKKSAEMPKNECYEKDTKKLMSIILLSGALTTISTVLYFMFETPMPINELFTIFLGCATIYVSGQKLKITQKSKSIE